jgi:hypothetical protein
MSKDLCSRCGREIHTSQAAIQITKGTKASEGLDQAAAWGLLHERCFYRSMRTPEAALSEIRLLTEEASNDG